MAYLLKQGSRIDYNYKEFYLDTAAELSEIDTASLCPGSVAYVVSTGAIYILNNEKEWTLQ